MTIWNITLTALLAAAPGSAQTSPDLPSLSQVQEQLALSAEQEGRVWLRIAPEGNGAFRLEDSFLRIRIKADRRDDGFSLWGDAGEETVSLQVRKSLFPRESYTITGSGVDLTLTNVPAPEHENRDYKLEGTVREAGQLRQVGLTFTYNQDWRRYYVKDAGGAVDLHLDASSGWELEGKVQMDRFGKKSLAALSAAALGVIVRDRPRRERPGRDRP